MMGCHLKRWISNIAWYASKWRVGRSNWKNTEYTGRSFSYLVGSPTKKGTKIQFSSGGVANLTWHTRNFHFPLLQNWKIFITTYSIIKYSITGISIMFALLLKLQENSRLSSGFASRKHEMMIVCSFTASYKYCNPCVHGGATEI